MIWVREIHGGNISGTYVEVNNESHLDISIYKKYIMDISKRELNRL